MKITLAGYFGCKNLGDEAILQSIVAQIKKHDENHRITVLTSSPKKTKENYNVNTLNRKKISNIIAAIQYSNLVVFAGGSIFQDITSIRSLLFYLLHIIIAKFLNKRIILYSQGITPFKHFISKLLFKNIAIFADRITVRDRASLEYLNKIGFQKTVYISLDSALELVPLKIERKYNNTIALNLRPLHHLKKKSIPYYEITAALTTLIKKKKKKILYLPMHPDDLEIGIKLQMLVGEQHFKIAPKTNLPSELLSHIEQCDMLIGMRLHSLVFASVCSVPFIGINYDVKVNSFIDEFDQLKINLNEVTKEKILNSYENVTKNKTKYVLKIKNTLNNFQKMSEGNKLGDILEDETA
jgi:polysaccharide pyruvyl transferase CsaB